MAIHSINPATGKDLATYPETAAAEVQTRLRAAEQAFRAWREMSFPNRAGCLRQTAVGLRKRKEEFARLMAQEMGKPVGQGRSEIDKCALGCEFYADRAESFLAPENIATDAASSFIAFNPLGIVLAVMPWNFPFWQVFRCAAPALMAGNTVLLKHASNVPGCALAIEAVFEEAGLPRGVFQTLLIRSEAVADLIKTPAVKAVSLTGSVSAGRAIAAQAGQALKKTVLELGGSDAYVVLEDCDLEKTVETCVASRLINTGQSCIAAKRFIVVDSVWSGFEELFVEEMAAAKVGDPLSDATTVGPMARRDLRDELHHQVERSLAQGARLLLGGKRTPGDGAFYPPTVLSNVRKGMAAFDEETFGPVAALIRARDEAEAIELANASSFGLGAAVFTKDRIRGERIAAQRLEAGACFVNEYVRSDPRLPFGGIKDSGYGRELGIFGIREFVNVKTVYVQ